jgi:ribosomal protein S6--L-glutamate ligase
MNKPRIGVIGIPGKWSTEVLADRVEEATGYRQVIDMTQVAFDGVNNRLMAGDVDLTAHDGLLVKKISEDYSPATLDRLELLRVAEAQGVRVFSPASSMLRLIDRLSCTVTLRNHHIPMPDTLVTEDLDAATDAVEQFGDAVLKPLFSTKARGMTLVSSDASRDSIRSQLAHFQSQNPVIYLQKKLTLSGRDLGLVFLGGQYLGAYARVAQTDAWNTTIHSGGRYELATPSDDIIAMASKAQSLFDMDFTTVDVAETETGAICFEVSAFGGFKGALEGAGIDAASAYVSYALEQLA